MDITGIILAGGYSSRFGSEKAIATLDGEPLIHHAARALDDVCVEVIAVVRADQDSRDWPSMRIVTDVAEMPEGPLRGVYAGLAASATPWAYVVSCDSPRMQPDLLRLLYQSRQGGEHAVVARWDGHIQPLVALYHTSCTDVFRALLESGERSPRRALASVPHTVVDEAECARADPDGLSFVSVNRAEDLQRLAAAPTPSERA